MRSIYKQKGMTPIGWLLVILIGLLFVIIALTLIPVYLESFNVASIMNDLNKDPAVSKMSPGEVTSTIVKRLDINAVTSVTKDDIYIERTNTDMTIGIDYEVRKNLVGNIDVVISFDKSIEVPVN